MTSSLNLHKRTAMQNLQDKVVFITGASSGFGAATAIALVKEGAKVILGARREEKLQRLVDELGGEQNAVFQKTDVTNEAELKTLFEKGLNAFGKVDALINNAGVAYPSELKIGEVNKWNEMIDVNIKGVLNGIHTVLNHMLDRGNGNIVNICSISGHNVAPGFAVYCATKFAVKAISEGLRQETSGKIQVTNISPGLFDTEILKGEIADKKTADLVEQWLPVAQAPERVVESILFALKQDPGVAINELTIRPCAQ